MPEAAGRPPKHFESIGFKDQDSLIAGSHRTRQAHRNDIFRRDDCMGAGGGTILRSVGPEL